MVVTRSSSRNIASVDYDFIKNVKKILGLKNVARLRALYPINASNKHKKELQNIMGPIIDSIYDKVGKFSLTSPIFHEDVHSCSKSQYKNYIYIMKEILKIYDDGFPLNG